MQSMDLDSGRIYNKYRLVGLEDAAFDRRLKAMKTDCNVTDIQFGRDPEPQRHGGPMTVHNAAR